MNGVINVYKEAGFTSHDVVAVLRKILNTKKIGHTGTLDPDATGVLPVCVGNATRLCDLLTDETKEYVAELRLGITTVTQDRSGKILKDETDKVKDIPDEKIAETIKRFVGEIEQIPPMYSAIKVNGQKLYNLARSGIEIERKSRKIKIEEIEILDVSLHKVVKMRVVCSKGTYIRTLCHDIGNELGCGGCMESLERTRVGSFSVEDAYTLDEIRAIKEEDGLHNIITPVDVILKRYEPLNVLDEGMKLLKNGNRLSPALIKEVDENKKHSGFIPGEIYRIYGSDGKFYGIYDFHSLKNTFDPVKMFLPDEDK
ncbi:MAG: tRNA pseudouridine(55) synthase TruB [Lachnospiraceae bacterium]|nr:tRNA pseudouridine(55) synthase TruB [Lachnospiraceae bacterium]